MCLNYLEENGVMNMYSSLPVSAVRTISNVLARMNKQSSESRFLIASRTLIVFILLLAAVSLPAPVNAQDFRIDSSSVAQGQTDVALLDSLFFYTNQKLPFNSLFTSKFQWEPRRQVDRQYIFLDADRQSPRFTILHEADLDYSVIVFGVRSENDTPMSRPYVLNYTTASTIGANQVSGTVVFGERTPPSSKNGGSISRMILDAFVNNRVAPSNNKGSATANPTFAAKTNVRTVPEPRRAAAFEMNSSSVGKSGSTQADNLDRTVLYLLSTFSIDQPTWTVQTATAINADGTYSFDYVRDGNYYPVAVNFGDDDGFTISSYGFYDANGDFEPDPVAVAGGSVTDIDMTLLRYGPVLANAYRTVADYTANAVEQNRILYNIRSEDVLPTGEASSWMYNYYSDAGGPGGSQFRTIEIDPLLVATTAGSLTLDPFPDAIPASGTLDSDAAIGIAQSNGGSEFLSANEGHVRVLMQGGNAYDDYPSDPTRLTWYVEYIDLESIDRLIILMDMTDGTIIYVTTTDVEPEPGVSQVLTLDGNYPNPFATVTSIPYTLDKLVEVHISVFNILGQEVAVLFDGQQQPGSYEASWEPREQPNGIYFVKLQADDRSMVQQMSLAR